MNTTTRKLTARDLRITHVAALAATAFAEHRVSQRLRSGMFRSWRCKRPESWAYGFDISTTPGVLLVAGDIGTLVVERTNDMIHWARSAVGSIDYFAEKVAREMPTTEYDPDIAREWIEDEIAEIKASAERWGDDEADEKIEKLKSFDDGMIENSHDFFMQLYGSGLVDGCDWPDFNNYTHAFLWQREAVKWFLTHWPQD